MPEYDVSIIIPTKNGEGDIEKCLSGILAQSSKYSYEVIVIDSGSSDNTVEVVRRFPVSIVQIRPEQFGHGRTRNLGASLAKGKYLVYFVQDAYPANERWLESLVRNLEGDDEVGGAYSRCLPKPSCNPIDLRVIRQLFGPVKEIRSLRTLSEEDRRNYLTRLILFSDVSSCIRKSVWESIPFDETLASGEDQGWSKEALLAGYAIVYESESLVYHSHNDSFKQTFKRAFDFGSSYRHVWNAKPGFFSMPLTIVEAAATDFIFMRQNKTEHKVMWLMWSAIHHSAFSMGLWFGTHQNILPVSMRKRFSTMPHMFGSTS